MVQIRLEGVRKLFGSFEALRGIDLTIADGEFVVFVGPSGCGKSTLLRVIAGLEDCSGGDIYFGEKRFTNVPPAKRGVAMVFQSYALYPHMNVADNMTMSLRLAGVPRPERRSRAEEVADMLQLSPYLDRKPGQLSGGQRQRVAIGRAIVRAPEVYLFDEPLSNLDAALRVETRVGIARLHRRLGNTMIYVTHDQVEAMTMADRIVVLEDGQVAQAGTPLDLYHSPNNLFVAGFIGSPKMNLIPVTETSQSATGRVVKLGDLPPVALSGRHAGGPAATLGVRPERLHVAADGPLKGRVTAVEHLGSETLIYAEVAGSNVVAKAVEDLTVAVDDAVAFAFSDADYHLFDAAGFALKPVHDVPALDAQTTKTTRGDTHEDHK